MSKFEKQIDKLHEIALKAFNEKIGNKEYPHPINLPVGLLDNIENGRWETAYTRNLAYLLDCSEHHGYGDAFLKELLKRVDHEVDCKDYLVCAEKSLLGEEKGRFDIYIPNVLVIEAKTADVSKATLKKQLDKYDHELLGKKGLKKVSLTIDTVKAKSNWKNITWRDIIDVIWTVIKGNPQKVGYWFAKYFISSIYTNLYGDTSEFVNIYNFVNDEALEEAASQLEDFAFDFEMFKKHPSAVLALYDYTDEDSEFDKAYNECVKKLKSEIKGVWGESSDLHNPETWNISQKISKDIYLNIAITNKMKQKGEDYVDGLYWFYNIFYDGKERVEHQLKLEQALANHKQFQGRKYYTPQSLGLEKGDITILGVIPFGDDVTQITKDFEVIRGLVSKLDS